MIIIMIMINNHYHYRCLPNKLWPNFRINIRLPPCLTLELSYLTYSQFTHLSVEESAVKRAVLTFPAGSSGGPGSDLLSALTAFTNLVLSGRCPSEIAPVFFGGRALALNNKDGGIRPICIGFTL